MTSKPTISASVREVGDFVCRTGDLGTSSGFGGRNRALDGTRGHQRLQKNRPAGYEPEVVVRWQSEQPTFIFELKGRIDGVLVTAGQLLIEEIKTVRRPWTGLADSLHSAQAKIYAFICAQERGFKEASIRITYLHLSSADTVELDERFSFVDLHTFFHSVITEYLVWLEQHHAWCSLRDASIQQLPFPFTDYRPGQRSFAVAVYRGARDRGKLFAEAPTGIGKTVSVLFPAIKAMAGQHVEKIFYLTARTVGRTIAQETLSTLRSAGLRLRAVTLTAKEKVCFNQGQPCDPRTCPFALGYYDRLKAALHDALKSESFTRDHLEAIARKHSVCPFEFSLDLSLWADLIICDYNYVFDLTVSLKRYFDGEKHRHSILVDEAHNLLDRAREMFSASLERDELMSLMRALDQELPACARSLHKICARLKSLSQDETWSSREKALVSKTPPKDFDTLLEQFLDQAELWLVQETQTPFREELLSVYFRVLSFQRILELYDERYITICERDPLNLRLFCLDASTLLRSALKRTGHSVFFSATLRPLEYFRDAFGGEPLDPILQLSSPFPPENLAVLIHLSSPTRLNARSGSHDAVASSVAALVTSRPGNYLVFFSSYAYLAEVLERFRSICPSIRVEVQSPGMTEAQRDAFLGNFQEQPGRTLVAFAVLGGIFGEGIDLHGERLIGVIVVGVGLPQICLERDLIKESFQERGLAGFDYAYTFPGMNRVLQAVGRVIRSETDRGIVLLIDERFAQPRYRNLFPLTWRPQFVRSPTEIQLAAQNFWAPRLTGSPVEIPDEVLAQPFRNLV